MMIGGQADAVNFVFVHASIIPPSAIDVKAVGHFFYTRPNRSPSKEGDR